jgi:hypothetical protein
MIAQPERERGLGNNQCSAKAPTGNAVKDYSELSPKGAIYDSPA